MPTRVPSLLTADDLPLAELHALRLDGVVVSVDSCFAPIDEVPGAIQRANALAEGLHDRLVAEQWTAAWVWGARVTAPLPHQFCVGLEARVTHSTSPWMTLREVVIDPRDVSQVGSLGVTTPGRTVVDLARFSPTWGPEEHDVVVALMELGQVRRAILERELGRNKLPHKRRAYERLGLSPS
jgi:hypothetical protein